MKNNVLANLIFSSYQLESVISIAPRIYLLNVSTVRQSYQWNEVSETSKLLCVSQDGVFATYIRAIAGQTAAYMEHSEVLIVLSVKFTGSEQYYLYEVWWKWGVINVKMYPQWNSGVSRNLGHESLLSFVLSPMLYMYSVVICYKRLIFVMLSDRSMLLIFLVHTLAVSFYSFAALMFLYYWVLNFILEFFIFERPR